jgi:hypothetical protein
MDSLCINRLEYDAVRRANLDAAKVHRADGMAESSRGAGSFVNSLDNRLLITSLTSNMGAKKTVSYSFDPVPLVCKGCTVNHARNVWKIKGREDDPAPSGEAFMLTDQSYPPVLPCSGEQKCVKIIRREDASIMDLANELIGLVRGKSIVLMHSLSHMARVGTEAYAEDILVATSKIKAVLGQQIEVVPLPHLFVAGCTDPLAIRTAAEFTSWAAKVYGKAGKFLKTGFQMANFLLQAKVGDVAQVYYERLARMPTSTKWPSTKATWIFSGYDLRQAIQPVSEIMEAEIIKLIIKGIRTGLALDLEVSPSFDRMAPVKGGGQLAKTDYLLIGRSSVVAMMVTALEKAGKKVQSVHQQEWRVTKAFVAHTAEATAKAIKEYMPEAVILTGLDESYYMAQFEEVHTSPARRDLEGRYHIDGDLVVASKDAQLRLLHNLEPVWKATVGYKTIVVGPMLRYITGGCCDDPEHIPNRNKPDFTKNLKKEMVVAKNTLREFLRTSGNHHCRVLDPGMDMAGKEPGEIWGTTPHSLALRSTAVLWQRYQWPRPESTWASGEGKEARNRMLRGQDKRVMTGNGLGKVARPAAAPEDMEPTVEEAEAITGRRHVAGEAGRDRKAGTIPDSEEEAAAATAAAEEAVAAAATEEEAPGGRREASEAGGSAAEVSEDTKLD